MSMHCGKAATKFYETATELENTVLTNQKFQKTRFVRSLQRGITAALRNLPTMASTVGKEYNEEFKAGNKTRAIELKKILDDLTSAKNLFFSIGTSQLLESYCEASLASQYSNHLPIQVWQKIDSVLHELEKMATKWAWKESLLKIAGIGTPQKLITSILLKGSFEPYVPPGSLKRSTTDVDFSALLEGDELFEENQRKFEPAGSYLIRDANDQTLTIVENKLQNFAKEVLNRLNHRFNRTELQEATMKAFGQIYLEITPENIQKMIELLQKVIDCLPSDQSELFDAQQCYPGFLAWNEYWKVSFNRENTDNKLDPLKNVHIYYENWKKTATSDENLIFQNLWELLMIRGTSEAICETIGSMMGTHSGKNRNLLPEHFSNEMVLRVNLGPLHLMGNLIDEILTSNAKSYVRAEKRLNQLPSKDINKTSTIDTFEQKNEKKSRFPLCVWQK